jgi:hypothetical protein
MFTSRSCDGHLHTGPLMDGAGISLAGDNDRRKRRPGGAPRWRGRLAALGAPHPWCREIAGARAIEQQLRGAGFADRQGFSATAARLRPARPVPKRWWLSTCPARRMNASNSANSRADNSISQSPRLTCRVAGSSRSDPTSITDGRSTAPRRARARSRASSSGGHCVSGCLRWLAPQGRLPRERRAMTWRGEFSVRIDPDGGCVTWTGARVAGRRRRHPRCPKPLTARGSGDPGSVAAGCPARSPRVDLCCCSRSAPSTTGTGPCRPTVVG